MQPVAQQFPDVSDYTYSGSLGCHNNGYLNNSFYSFGAQHTNIKDMMFKNPQTPLKSGNTRS